jgi:hypothetical protein
MKAVLVCGGGEVDTGGQIEIWGDGQRCGGFFTSMNASMACCL